MRTVQVPLSTLPLCSPSILPMYLYALCHSVPHYLGAYPLALLLNLLAYPLTLETHPLFPFLFFPPHLCFTILS